VRNVVAGNLREISPTILRFCKCQATICQAFEKISLWRRC